MPPFGLRSHWKPDERRDSRRLRDERAIPQRRCLELKESFQRSVMDYNVALHATPQREAEPWLPRIRRI
jgi:hypothetical protein